MKIRREKTMTKKFKLMSLLLMILTKNNQKSLERKKITLGNSNFLLIEYKKISNYSE